MDLVIDIGNSFQKAAVFSHDGKMVFLCKNRDLTIPFLEDICERFSIKRSIVSSVSFENKELDNWLRLHTSSVVLSHESKLPIVLKYSSPETLGTDRIADAAGARTIFPDCNVLSIMAGTCLVTDFVNISGEYLGGSIAPGLRMRFGALQHFTARLPLVEPKKIDFLTGDTTENSILSGVINGIALEIDGIIEEYSRKFPDLKVILSGGDAELLQNYLKKSIFAAQNPILAGLHKILQLNAS